MPNTPQPPEEIESVIRSFDEKKVSTDESYSMDDINAVLSEYVCFAPNEGCSCKEQRAAVEHFIGRLKSKRKSMEECKTECGPREGSAVFICKHGNMFSKII